MRHENPLLLYMLARDDLEEEEIGLIRDLTRTAKRREAGSELVTEGHSPSASCLMLEGYSARFHLLADGSRNISAIHVAGDFVDLHSLLLQPMDHGVVAISDCTVCMVPHGKLLKLTEAHPHLARLFWLSTLIDAAMHRRWLVAAGRLSAIGRLAHFLCEIYVRLKTVHRTDDRKFHLPMTQTQLSDAMGLSAVHVNRTLQGLRQRHLIRWEDGIVEILDWDALRAVADFDPDYLNLRKEGR